MSLNLKECQIFRECHIYNSHITGHRCLSRFRILLVGRAAALSFTVLQEHEVLVRSLGEEKKERLSIHSLERDGRTTVPSEGVNGRDRQGSGTVQEHRLRGGGNLMCGTVLVHD